MKALKSFSYADYLRSHRWRENSLASDDEDVAGAFDWRLMRRFGPYLGRFRLASSASVILMVVYTALNIANPLLIGIAIDNLITHRNLNGLLYAIGGLVVLNVAMWQAQYWQVWNMSSVGEQVLDLL